MPLTLRTAGESHGPALTALIEGLPGGVRVDKSAIDGELARRQSGYGRSGRMKLEKDEVAILAGVRAGLTTGAPVVLQIANRDNRLESAPPIHRPRPGHADFAGSMKWLTTDCRNTLERASARETAARTAAGALCRSLLGEFGIEIAGFVTQIGDIATKVANDATAETLRTQRDASELLCPDSAASAEMVEATRSAKQAGDTLGGVIEIRAFGLPPGLGSCAAGDLKLDGRLMQAVGSIQAIKGVEIGVGFAAAAQPGSRVHDAIYFDAAQRNSPNAGFVRRTNNAGGLEGGMTNGMPLIIRAAMKPISTLTEGMDSVNLQTLAPERSDYERSDICAVPAASVVAENVVAFELARAMLEKFSGDTLQETRAAYNFYLSSIRDLPSA